MACTISGAEAGTLSSSSHVATQPVSYKIMVHFPPLSLDSNRCVPMSHSTEPCGCSAETENVELEGLKQGKEHSSSLIIELLCKKEAMTAQFSRKPLLLLHPRCWMLFKEKPEER